jgi:hypothetical protein
MTTSHKSSLHVQDVVDADNQCPVHWFVADDTRFPDLPLQPPILAIYRVTFLMAVSTL